MRNLFDKSVFFEKCRNTLPGIVLTGLVVLVSFLLEDAFGISNVLLALMIGMLLNPLLTSKRFGKKLEAGVSFCGNIPLQIGTILLGLKITKELLANLSPAVCILLVSGVAATILFSLAINRWFGWTKGEVALTGTSVAICGASAVMALILVMGKDTFRRQTMIAVLISVMCLSSVAMVAYPLMLDFIGMNGVQSGFVLGGSIHNTSQVVGSCAAMGEDALAVGTMTKMIRVALLIPVMMVFISCFGEKDNGRRVNPLTHIPVFLIGFVILAVINVMGYVPAAVKPPLSLVSTVGILLAVASIGLKTNMRLLRNVGWSPVLMLTADSLFLFIWMVLGVHLLVP